MKNIKLILILLIVVVTGCTNKQQELKANPNIIYTTSASFDNMETIIKVEYITIKEHDYLLGIGRYDGGLSIIHAESCKCKEVKN